MFPQCRVVEVAHFVRNPIEMCVVLCEHHLGVPLLPGDGPSSPVTTAAGALHDSDCAVIFFLLN